MSEMGVSREDSLRRQFSETRSCFHFDLCASKVKTIMQSITFPISELSFNNKTPDEVLNITTCIT